MDEIRWGMIGCGSVTEMKSGPAFNKVSNSKLVAVMRRNAEAVQDYARRHRVPKWYTDADALIHDPEVNAIYIATPPDSHEAYTLQAFAAGKPVYVEKPMSVSTKSARHMLEAAERMGQKLSVAHYRRRQPLFLKIKELLDDGVIGRPLTCTLRYFKPQMDEAYLQTPGVQWRLNTAISGGGLFHDLAPHQLDLMIWFFGNPLKATGLSYNQAGMYEADDVVAGQIRFQNGTLFHGIWCFNVQPQDRCDKVIITGSAGSIHFPVFEHARFTLHQNGESRHFDFEPVEHSQQFLIQKVTDYFLGRGPNPCDGRAGVTTMELMEAMTQA